MARENKLIAQPGPDANPDTPGETELKIETVRDDDRFFYDVHENPPVYMTLFFAFQQVLMSLSRCLSTSLLVAELVCANTNEHFKARLLSTTMLMSGVCTLLQNTVGIRLPLYQGPAATYVVPLLALATLPEWRCDGQQHGPSLVNATLNSTVASEPYVGDHLDKVLRMEGSLMISGAIHMLVGATGLVGFLLRFIGPITIIPALTILALYIYSATVRFAKTQWGVSIFTVSIAIIFSFYLRRRQTAIPAWSRKQGFHIKYYPLHKMFSVLLACLLGWGLSAVLTAAGRLSSDPDSIEFYARTDSRLFVVKETKWFIFPYPGQFGPPAYDTGALITFMMGTISSIIDSIGDYYACAKVCAVPPPPKHAVNRGIAVEGFLSLMAGWAGAGHATSTYGGNIGAIGITRVASLRVFQVVGVIYIVFGVVGKIGAAFVTIPYSVVGGMMMVNFGVLIGVMLSNMQFIDMKSTRNLAIIGMSMLAALMFPHWVRTTPNAINTGNSSADGVITMFLANPAFLAAFLACFMDNTIPGTKKERGMLAYQQDLMGADEEEAMLDVDDVREETRRRDVMTCIYVIPYLDKVMDKLPFLSWIPFLPTSRKD